jgi:DNA-binding NarL/FixJ family response regulator
MSLELDPLTPQERNVIELVAQGYTDAQIAAALQLARTTVAHHVRSICQKMHVTSRTAAAVEYCRTYATFDVCHGFYLPSDPLSPREREVIALMAQGQTDQQIAVALSVARTTIVHHVRSICQKLRAANRTVAAVVYYCCIGTMGSSIKTGTNNGN